MLTLMVTTAVDVPVHPLPAGGSVTSAAIVLLLLLLSAPGGPSGGGANLKQERGYGQIV